MRRFHTYNLLFALIVTATLFIPAAAQKTNGNNATKRSHGSPLKLALPVKDGSLRFAVIGDTGSGSAQQREVGAMMIQSHTLFPFEFVLMMGDNMYGGEAPKDFEKKFAEPYGRC